MKPGSITLNRKQGNLVEQLADAIRQNIATGTFRSGQSLPTIAKWQALLGVSDYVPRRALAALSKEGLITVKKHVGAVVTGISARKWKGKVLVINNSLRQSFSENAFAFALQPVLEAGGYEVVHLPLPWTRGEESEFDFGILDRHLANGVDLVIVHTVEPRLTRHLDEHGVRYIVESSTERTFPNALGRFFQWDDTEGIVKLIAFWQKSGVRSVLIVDYTRVLSRTVVRAFAESRIVLRQLMVPVQDRVRNCLHEIPQNALTALTAFLRTNASRNQLPGAIFFYDDYLAIGGLTAIAASGLRVPEDIHIATISNRGFASAWFKPLTRIEHDPAANGRGIGAYVLGLLAGKRPHPPKSKTKFISGQT